MKKEMIKPITVERMLDSIMYHSERLNNLLGDDITLDEKDEDKLRDAYSIIFRLHNKIEKDEEILARMKVNNNKSKGEYKHESNN